MKTNPERGSYLPVLMRLVQSTDGTIIELGAGIYSTLYLHWYCFPTKRKLVTYESIPQWIDFAKQFETDYHQVVPVDNWDDIKFDEHCSIALVDHYPAERRIEEIKKLVDVDYVVAHDSETDHDKDYHYSNIRKLFRWRYTYDKAYPHTTIYSNVHNLNDFNIWFDEPPLPEQIMPVSEGYMSRSALMATPKRRYTICISLGEIYEQIDDPEIRLKLRYAATLSQYTLAKLKEYAPVWLHTFYPRLRDYRKVMKV